MALGNADVKARFKQRTHDLNVSTYALVVLLLFEELGESDFLTYEVSNIVSLCTTVTQTLPGNQSSDVD